MSRLLELMSDVEARKAIAFQSKHNECDGSAGAIGGAVTYSFTPTGLGFIVVLRCSICKQEENVTDFENW